MTINEKKFNSLFGSNLSKILEDRNVSQNEFARMMGVTSATVSNWCRGLKAPRMDKVDKMCQLLHIRRSDLIEKESETAPNYAVKIPILGTVVAGVPVSVCQDVLGYEEITPDMASTGEFYALQVKGNSMEPRICDGDVVIVKVQPDVESGDVAVVLVNGDEATVKQVDKNESGIVLTAFNPSVFSPKYYSNKDIEELPVVISGKVVELRARF